MKLRLLFLALCLTSAASAQEAAKQFIGPPIDVSSWSYQRTLQFDNAGVVELDLDVLAMTHMAADMRDLRIVRMGRLLPFLAVKPGADHAVATPVSMVIDPKAPLLSKWDIQLPAADFPASELVLESASPEFQHTLSLSELSDTPQGRVERILSTATWQRRLGEPARACHLVLTTPPHAATLRLSTTDTNTPRAEISSASILHPLVRLFFRVPDKAETVLLCYGNPGAIHPRYDLQFNRRDFDSAAKTTAALGPEEKPSVQVASINHLVGNASSKMETFQDRMNHLLEGFDRSNPLHLGGLILGVFLLVKIVKKIFTRSEEE